MTAKLVAEEGSLKGLVLSLESGDQWVIGRDPDACQLLIEDPVVSRRHLICRNTPEGIVLENLSATNPVLINHEPVDKPNLLQNGDLVKIGSGLFRFYAESEAQLVTDINGDDGEHLTNNSESEEEQKEEPLVEEESNIPEIEEAPIADIEEAPIADIVEPAESVESPKEEETSSIPDSEPSHEEIFLDDELEEEGPIEEGTLEKEIHSRRDTIFNEEEEEHDEQLLADIDFEITEAGRWLLKVIAGPNSGAEFTMQSGHSYTIGSDPKSCDIIFHDTSISRQHARLNVSEEDIITIQDLNSRNGTLVDGERLKEKQALQPNIVVNLGTTAFVIFDKEGEMHTIISPLLPGIVNVLKQEEEASSKEKEKAEEKQVIEAQKTEAEIIASHEENKEKSKTTLTAFILIAIITGAFVLAGIGMVTLFKSEPIEIHQASDIDQRLTEALAPFPGVEKTYNSATGTLMVVGHVLNDNGWRQLQYNLRDLDFIKHLDVKGVVIDEKVWQEFNPVIAKNPAWRGVTLQASAPGQFVLTGYLRSRDQMESLREYMTTNFLYLDRLKYIVVVEDSVIANTKLRLMEAGFPNIAVTMSQGDLTLKGVIPSRMADPFEKLLTEFKQIPGVRNVQDLVTEIQEDRSTINITDRYLVTGVSRTANNVSVVIDGRIVSKGDTLDGMKIVNITASAMLLEKDGVNYQIDLK